MLVEKNEYQHTFVVVIRQGGYILLGAAGRGKERKDYQLVSLFSEISGFKQRGKGNVLVCGDFDAGVWRSK